MQLVGRLACRPPWAKEGRWPGEVEESLPPVGRASRCEPLPTTGLGTSRRRGELCPLEAMLLGVGEPESWFMDCSPPAAAWELPPPQGEELGAELGSLEEMGAAFTEPSLAASSLGSWADECERADAALAPPRPRWVGDAQMRVWETTPPPLGTCWRRRTGSG